MIEVVKFQGRFAIVHDGILVKTYATRTEASKAATELRESL